MSRAIYYQILRMIRAKCSTLTHLPRPRTIAWLRWHAEDRRLAVQMIGNTVVGFGLVRCTSETEKEPRQYDHDEKGPVAWVELVVAENAWALQALVRDLVKRVGEKKVIGFCRGAKDGRARFYDFNTVTRRLLREGTA